MGYLANAGDIPAIFMMQGVAYFAFHYPARVIPFDNLKAIRALVFFVGRELDLGLAPHGIPALGAADPSRRWRGG